MDLNVKHDLKERMNESINSMIDCLDLIDDEKFGAAVDLWTWAVLKAKCTTDEIVRAKFAAQ